MKKLFVLMAIFALVLAGCGDGDSTSNGNDGSNTQKSTSLKISNHSSYEIFNVKYTSVNFGDIDIGAHAIMNVSIDVPEPIYFDLSINNNRIPCKTNGIITCDEGSTKEENITSNTFIRVIKTDQMDTLSAIYNALSKPIFELSQNNTVISNNALSPINFGRVLLNSTSSLTFNIKNTGNINLELTGTPAVTSSSPAFVVLAQPMNKTIQPGSSAEFMVRYVPTIEGEDTGYLTILNNAGGAFTLNVKGTGYIKRPQITIIQSSTIIAPYGEFNFGAVSVGSSNEIAFIIKNTGEANLSFVTVNSNCVNLDDNGDGRFNVTFQPIASTIVTPESTANFSIRFSPSATGVTSTATVVIKTNSENNEEFAFRIRGSGGYKIGDTGPGGGIIFYAVGSEFKECTKTNLGSNTDWDSARSMANNYTGGGFINWHLPTLSELNSMYLNLHKNSPALGGFENYPYWTSIEANNISGTYYSAYRINFTNGSQDTISKTSGCYSRAVRSFTL